MERKFNPVYEFSKEVKRKNAVLKNHVEALRFSPIAIAHFAAQLYTKRVYSKVAFEVALAKLAMLASEEIGEKIQAAKDEIEEEFIEIMKSVRICEQPNFGFSHLAQTELSVG